MEIKLGKNIFAFGSQNARMAGSNNRDVNALTQNCDPEPLIYLYTHGDRWLGRGKALPWFISTNSAEAFLSAGREDIVLQILDILLPQKTDAAEPSTYFYLQRSRVYTQLEQWEKAIEAQNEAMSYFSRVEEKQHPSVNVWYLCLNGYTLQLHNGETEGLEEKCLRLLNRAPYPKGQVEAHLLLGKLYLAEGRKEEAEAHLSYVIENGNKLLIKREAELLWVQLKEIPLTKEQLLFSAERTDVRERYADSIPLYERAVSAYEAEQTEFPSEGYLSFAGTLLCLGKWSDALAQLERIKPWGDIPKQEEVKLARSRYQAIAYREMGRLEEAVEAQNQAMSIFRKNRLEAYRDLLCHTGFAIKIKLGELDGLEDQIDTLLKRDKKSFQNHMLKANYLLAAGRKEEAKPYLEYVVKNAGEHWYRQEAQAALDPLQA